MSLGHLLRTQARGALRPPENDSAFLLDVQRRAVPRERMARYDDDYAVDLAIVGAGAGGGTLAQRLARRGWRVVVLGRGPFWDPDEDWVSDEAGSHQLYWTDKRIIGGEDPVELGKNNSGRGVGGSMIHYAGYCPRFHPSDFEVRTRDGVGEDWPISYQDLKPHYERLELELPVAGDYWPWGDPHGYPHGPHPIAGGADLGREGARKLGIEMRVGPVGITNGSFGNRPHCIYRGFCLQACKVNAKAPPPEISSEQFYETDPTRGFARGFSLQTVGPLPIDWARHVLADGHWGPALREYMRDYNHWYTLGALSELLPLPENRVTISSEVTDANGIPVARMDYSQCENDRKNIAMAKRTLNDIFEAAEAQDVLTIDRYAHLVGGCR